jgi:hypothetical protein
MNGKQQTHRICSARNGDNDSFVARRQIKPPPFGDEISDELMHTKSLAHEMHEIHE